MRVGEGTVLLLTLVLGWSNENDEFACVFAISSAQDTSVWPAKCLVIEVVLYDTHSASFSVWMWCA